MTTAYRSRPITRPRRSKAAISAIEEEIYMVAGQYRPVTVRQVFYQLVSRGVIAKTEAEYTRTVIRLLTKMRLEQEIPFAWIADNTRWMRKPTTYSSAEEALQETARFYRAAVWRDQPVYVEIWLEKEALSGVLFDVTSRYDVPLMVTRGYSSLSYVHAAAETIAAKGKPAFVYYFGDHDPSGRDIERAVEARLRQFAPTAEIHFERIAVTTGQIEAWRLPTRPTKPTDTRSKSFEGESVEVDAIDPERLRDLATDAIERHLPAGALAAIHVAEESERQVIEKIAAAMEGDEG